MSRHSRRGTSSPSGPPPRGRSVRPERHEADPARSPGVPEPEDSLTTLVARYDPTPFAPEGPARVRLEILDDGARDVREMP